MNSGFRVPRYQLLCLALAASAAVPAWADDCKFTANRSAGVDAKGVEKVVMRTGAGDLKVVGPDKAARIEARGVACAGKQALLDKSQISVRREGNVVYIETSLPQDESGWSWGDNDYAYIDLGVALPSNIPVEATDSSGDARFEDLASLTVQDSSGDLKVWRIAGLADISDSSGDIQVQAVGSVRLRDSSGSIKVDDVRGDVEVVLDSSGDIDIVGVGGNVRVRQDSSGNIQAENVKGSFVVDSDSSGSIFARHIDGDFTVREDSSGSIGHESIGGRVSVPSK
jgi:hypothetical protein